MDLCQESLVDFMRGQESKLPTAGILQIFSAVCQAVAAMHQQNPPLIHRCFLALCMSLFAKNALRFEPCAETLTPLFLYSKPLIQRGPLSPEKSVTYSVCSGYWSLIKSSFLALSSTFGARATVSIGLISSFHCISLCFASRSFIITKAVECNSNALSLCTGSLK